MINMMAIHSYLQLDRFESANALLDAARSKRTDSHSQLTQLLAGSALTSAGFSAEQAAQALAATGGNVEDAVNW